MIRKKKQGAKDTKAQCGCKNLGDSWLVSSIFFVKSKKKKYQRKSSTLKHTVINNNKF